MYSTVIALLFLIPKTKCVPIGIAHSSIRVQDVANITRDFSHVIQHPTETGEITLLQPQAVKLPSPIKVEVLDTLLEKYEYRNYLVQGFSNGFDVHFEGVEKRLDSTNAQNALDNPNIVWSKLEKEIRLGRIAGPFKKPPFKNFKVSPLNIREKSEKGKYRLLHNLSYPYDDRSVNFNIPTEFGAVTYETLEDAVEYINNDGPDAWLAKSDIADAFYLIPIRPECYRYMGFQWEGNYYYYKVLPMGCKSSCAIFSEFSDSIKWLLQERVPHAKIVKVLDDFLFVGNTKSACNLLLNTFKSICAEMGVPVAQHKTVDACQDLIFLGIRLDTRNMVATLPTDKILRYGEKLEATLEKRKITLTELKSLLGTLQYATSVVRGGKAFLRRMYDLTRNVKHGHYKITLTKEVKEDLVTWQKFLQLYNGVTMIRESIAIDSNVINLFSDSSLEGYGGTYGRNFICGKFPNTWKSYSITVLETYPILALIVTFKNKLKNSRVIFNCDNLGVVSIINSQSSKNPLIMVMIRKLVLCLLLNNIKFTARHIPGKTNIICDLLSRKQVSEAELGYWGLNKTPTSIPESIRPENLI